jgi:polar amino acid transport system substrate-binding protein
MGMVMEKDSPLTECVNEAIEAVRESGQLQAIYEQWINSAQDIPTYE